MRIFLSLLVLVLTILSGCTAPDDPAPVTVLHEDHTIGERLFSHGWSPFVSNINAPVMVPDWAGSIGMRFTGRLSDEESRANATLKDPGSRERLALRAAHGLPDDTTTIIEDFVLTGTTAAAAGEWQLRIASVGTLARATIDVHGIPRAPEPLVDRFEVPRDGRLTLHIQVNGWGEAPAKIELRRADGTTVATIPVDGARTTIKTEIQVNQGTHSIEADTPGWGGTLAWRGVLE